MKKKLFSIALAVFMVFGLGNVVFAHSGQGNTGWSFDEMLPFMQQMHPDMDQQDMEQMYQDCHGSNGDEA